MSPATSRLSAQWSAILIHQLLSILSDDIPLAAEVLEAREDGDLSLVVRTGPDARIAATRLLLAMREPSLMILQKDIAAHDIIAGVFYRLRAAEGWWGPVMVDEELAALPRENVVLDQIIRLCFRDQDFVDLCQPRWESWDDVAADNVIVYDMYHRLYPYHFAVSALARQIAKSPNIPSPIWRASQRLQMIMAAERSPKRKAVHDPESNLDAATVTTEPQCGDSSNGHNKVIRSRNERQRREARSTAEHAMQHDPRPIPYHNKGKGIMLPCPLYNVGLCETGRCNIRRLHICASCSALHAAMSVPGCRLKADLEGFGAEQATTLIKLFSRSPPPHIVAQDIDERRYGRFWLVLGHLAAISYQSVSDLVQAMKRKR